MASTNPNNLRSPEPGDNFNYVNDFVTLANDVQSALDTKVDKGPDPADVDVVRDVKAGRDVKAARDTSVGRNLTVTGQSKTKTIRVTSTTDLSLKSTGHGIQVGADNGLNVGIDNNEIMARNNGKASSLGLNWDGGNIGLGHASSTINMPGRLNSPHLPWAMAASQTRVSASFPIVKLPANRFTKAPRVVAQLMTGAGADIGLTAMVTNITTKQFQARHTGKSGTRLVDWIAIQMSSGNANG